MASERNADIRTEQTRTTGRHAVPAQGPRLRRNSRAFAPCGAAPPARGVRAAGGAPLHPPIADELFDRYALLSAWLLHDEVQPEGVQQLRHAAGISRAASAWAGAAGISGLYV